MCTCGTGNLVLHALLSCRRRRPEDLVGLCKLVAVLISLFFFSSIVTQCSCFFCLFFVGFFFNMRKRLLMAAMIFMVRSPGWCHGWSASGVCLHSSALLSKTWAALLLRVNTGVKETREFLLRAGATLLMVKFLAGLLPSMWQKCLIINMDSPMLP